MCSIILKVLFLGGLAGGVVLTCVALATTHWREFDDVLRYGLFQTCITVGKGKIADECRNSWHNAPAWIRGVAVCLFVALGLSLFAFGWWLLACIGCCCQKFLAPPLPIFALVLLLLDVAAVSTFAAMHNGAENDIGKDILGKLVGNGSYGFSFWCAVAAIGSFGLTVLIGCGVVASQGKRDRAAYREI